MNIIQGSASSRGDKLIGFHAFSGSYTGGFGLLSLLGFVLILFCCLKLAWTRDLDDILERRTKEDFCKKGIGRPSANMLAVKNSQSIFVVICKRVLLIDRHIINQVISP